MDKYKDLSQGIFDEILDNIVGRLSTHEIMAIPGIYECMSEEFNNQVLDEWEVEQRKVEISRLEDKYNRFHNAQTKLEDIHSYLEDKMLNDTPPYNRDLKPTIRRVEKGIKYIDNLLEKLDNQLNE